MPGPYGVAMGKRDAAVGWRAACMRPLQMPGELAAMIVGGGVPDAPRVSSLSRVTCRAASPLAVVVVFGSGKVPREGFIPLLQTKKQEPLHSGRLLLYG